MKQFDLNEALIKNKSVKLRNGQRATLTKIDLDYMGFHIYGELEKGGDERWMLDGTCGYYDNHPLDIIGMWEDEPEFKLPKPVRKLEKGKNYYFINIDLDDYYEDMFTVDVEEINGYLLNKCKYNELFEHGQLFETKEDAQAWLDFMKNYGKDE